MPRVAAATAQVGIYTVGKDDATQPNGQFIIDVAGLRDPLSNRGFRHTHTDGRAIEVRKFVGEDDRVPAIKDLVELHAFLAFRGAFSNAKSGWISFVVRDHHGRWIAPAIGEILADHLSDLGYRVCCYHMSLDGGGTTP